MIEVSNSDWTEPNLGSRGPRSDWLRRLYKPFPSRVTKHGIHHASRRLWRDCRYGVRKCGKRPILLFKPVPGCCFSSTCPAIFTMTQTVQVPEQRFIEAVQDCLKRYDAKLQSINQKVSSPLFYIDIANSPDLVESGTGIRRTRGSQEHLRLLRSPRR